MKRRTIRTILAALTVMAAAVTVGAQAAGASRDADTPPYYGGDNLFVDTAPYGDAKGTTATLGWIMADYTYYYATTAGHAGPDGTPLYANYPTLLGTVQQHTTYPGLTTGPADTDVAPISVGGPFVWNGNTDARQVYNWETTNQDVGSTVCVDGAVTSAMIGGEICGVSNAAYGVAWNGGHLDVRSDCPGIIQCAQGGDSGGPVYAIFQTGTHTGEVEAVGTISASGQYSSGRFYVVWTPIRYIMQWVWTFNRHTNLLCDICSPEP